MKTLLIEKWYGRLGNNIGQVINCILIALYYKFNIKMPEHKYFNTTTIVINPHITNNFITDSSFFLYGSRVKDIDKKCFISNNADALALLKSIFNYPKIATPLGDNEVVMHVRSGDIFSNNPHGGYLQPPLSYYEKCMKGYDIVHMAAEDTKNPVINALCRKYPTIKFKVQTLEEDIALILSAKNVIASYGSFIPALLTISTNIKKLYTISYISPYYGNYERAIIDLEDYKRMMGVWKNSAEQRAKMLSA